MTNRSETAIAHSFFGQGWNFPIRFSPDEGTVELIGGVEDIEQSLHILLNTLPGERVTNLGYGCKVKNKIFDPIDGKFTFLAEEAVRDAIIFHEPRITIESLQLNWGDHANGIVVLELNYILKLTNARHNLVHPFSYLEANI